MTPAPDIMKAAREIEAELRENDSKWQAQCDHWMAKIKESEPDKDWSEQEAIMRRTRERIAADVITALQSERSSAVAEIERLRALVKEAGEVVRPFADRANAFDGIPPPKYFGDTDFTLNYSSEDTAQVKVGNLRAARAFLDKLEGR